MTSPGWLAVFDTSCWFQWNLESLSPHRAGWGFCVRKRRGITQTPRPAQMQTKNKPRRLNKQLFIASWVLIITPQTHGGVRHGRKPWEEELVTSEECGCIRNIYNTLSRCVFSSMKWSRSAFKTCIDSLCVTIQTFHMWYNDIQCSAVFSFGLFIWKFTRHSHHFTRK